jgi:hypothetical protein
MSLAGKTKRDAFETTEAAIAFMQTAKRPYFILIHYFDVHWPYRAFPDYVNKIRREGDPDPFTTPRTGGEDAEADHPEEDRPGDYMAVEKLRYAACIRQVDTALGDLLAFLGESGSGSGTLVIVTADHGESLGQHGWGGHGTELYDAVVRVPLVISYPAKYERAQRIRDQVRHIDLLPTILELAGVEDGGWREGASLCRLIETGARANAPGKLLPEDHALCENSLRRSPFSKCIRSDAWKLMIEPATGVTSLFDLKSDPGEINDLAGTGLPAETALAEMMARVPGRSLNGWRVALVGETPEESLDVRVRPVGGRVTNVNIVSGGNDLKIMAGEDSTSLTVRTQSRGLRLVVFETVPAGVAVDVEAAAGGGRSPGALLAGETGTHPLSRKIALTQDEALGLPRAFQHLRKSRTPAICLWWMAGEQMRRPAAAAPMSIEDKKRLKALGYLQ